MCREKTAFLFQVERIENECKHVTSRHVCTSGSEETRVVNKKAVYTIWYCAENCQVYNIILTLTLTAY